MHVNSLNEEGWVVGLDSLNILLIGLYFLKEYTIEGEDYNCFLIKVFSIRNVSGEEMRAQMISS